MGPTGAQRSPIVVILLSIVAASRR